MSAPDPQVRIHTLASPTGWAYWTCDGCGYRSIAKAGGLSLRAARRHSDVCKRLALGRLQARWDARDKAERALIKKWESTARVLSARYDDTGERELRGRSKALRIAADELARAIRGGE